MTAEPAAPGPDTGPYEVIHLGGQAAVVVPVADFLRLRALERAASSQELEDAEDTAAMLEWKARDAAGQTTFVPADEARRRLGLPALVSLPRLGHGDHRPAGQPRAPAIPARRPAGDAYRGDRSWRARALANFCQGWLISKL